MVAKQLGELRDGVRGLPQQRVRTTELPAGVPVRRPRTELLRELTDLLVVVPGVEVGNLEVALRG